MIVGMGTLALGVIWFAAGWLTFSRTGTSTTPPIDDHLLKTVTFLGAAFLAAVGVLIILADVLNQHQTTP